MTFCPKCRIEAASELDVCTICGADLVNEVPPEEEEEIEDTDWIELHVFPGTLYARIAVEMLLREGISAYSQSNVSGTTYYGFSSGFGTSSVVFVLENDLDDAMDIIQPMIDELPGEGEDYYFEYEN